MSYRTDFTTRELGRFPKQLQHVIHQALLLNWKGKFTADGGLHMVPPREIPGVGHIYVPITSHDPGGAAKALMAKIARTPPPEELVQHTAFGTFETVLIEQAPPELPDDELLTISPWLARKASNAKGATLYASEAVMERHWVSGRTDYACSWEGCDYDAASPHSVRSHYHVHRRKVSAERPTIAHSDDATPIYKGTVTRLANEINTAMNAVPVDGMNVEDWALALAQFIAAARHRAGELIEHDDTPDSPPTPEQLLDRIRALLLGQELENQRNLLAQVDDLREQVAELTKERNEADERRRKVEENMETFVSLAEELRREVNSGQVKEGHKGTPADAA